MIRLQSAFEEYMFKNTDYGEPVLLLWQNEPSVIVGKYQNTLEEINYDYVKEKGIRVIRRNTGGGAVYHDLGNLNYSFIIPDVELKVDFKTFTVPIVKALRSYGIAAEQTGRNDILAEGKKFRETLSSSAEGSSFITARLCSMYAWRDVTSALKVKPGKFKSKAIKSVRSV